MEKLKCLETMVFNCTTCSSIDLVNDPESLPTGLQCVCNSTCPVSYVPKGSPVPWSDNMPRILKCGGYRMRDMPKIKLLQEVIAQLHTASQAHNDNEQMILRQSEALYALVLRAFKLLTNAGGQTVEETSAEAGKWISDVGTILFPSQSGITASELTKALLRNHAALIADNIRLRVELKYGEAKEDESVCTGTDRESLVAGAVAEGSED